MPRWIITAAMVMPFPAIAQDTTCGAFDALLDGTGEAGLALPLWAVTNPFYTPVVLLAALAFFIPRLWANGIAAVAAGALALAMIVSWLTRDRSGPIEAAIAEGCIAPPTLSLALLVAILLLNIGQIARHLRKSE